MGRPKKKYNPEVDNPIIEATFDAGLGLTNVASALGIWRTTLVTWRKEHPELDKFIQDKQLKAIATLIERYKFSLETDPNPDWRIPKILQLVHHYYVDHIYVELPEIMQATSIHSRHDLVLKAATEGIISLDIAERLSKLLKDNADIYNMSEIEKRMFAIETALNNVITKQEF